MSDVDKTDIGTVLFVLVCVAVAVFCSSTVSCIQHDEMEEKLDQLIEMHEKQANDPATTAKP